MCKSNNHEAKKIGTVSMVKWSDGFKYKAKLLKKGSKLRKHITSLDFLLKINFIMIIYYLGSRLIAIKNIKCVLKKFKETHNKISGRQHIIRMYIFGEIVKNIIKFV